MKHWRVTIDVVYRVEMLVEGEDDGAAAMVAIADARDAISEGLADHVSTELIEAVEVPDAMVSVDAEPFA